VNASEIDSFIECHLNRAYLVETLSRLARVPTEISPGYNTFMEPDDPKLVHYVQDVLRPELVRAGAYDLLDVPRNNLVVQTGIRGTGRALLLMNYTSAQHHHGMDEPFSGKVASARNYGVDEPAVFGQGVSSCKAHQAVMLAVLKAMREAGIQPNGRLYWAINNESYSSHACSDAIIDTLDEKPQFGIIHRNTDLCLSLGNRGRVDVNIHVRGKSSHSSRPDLGASAIDGAAEVIQRLKNLSWSDSHPLLGKRHAVAYKVRYEPVLPHTLPSDAWIAIDRRMLPGDDPAAVADEIRQVIGDMAPYEVTVTPGVYMLPALVDANGAGVQALQAAHHAVTRTEVKAVYGQGTFDAGGPCARGIPTVMYGASGGDWPNGIDFVPISAAETEARVLIHTIGSILGFVSLPN
jgi:acetylornithine deacetylase/succinyl-diaminopimelate desuccinylase-like protein